jgi:hypothetical protein
MSVGQVCRRNVDTMRRFDGVVAAAQPMRERQVGYLVVVEPGQNGVRANLVGALTDRDAMDKGSPDEFASAAG